MARCPLFKSRIITNPPMLSFEAQQPTQDPKSCFGIKESVAQWPKIVRCNKQSLSTMSNMDHQLLQQKKLSKNS